MAFLRQRVPDASHIRGVRFNLPTLAPLVVTLVLSVAAQSIAAVCTVSANCSGHATSVSEVLQGNGSTLCQCACSNQWGGSSCDMCSSIYNESLDCAACAVHRGHYPTCDAGCNNADNCNGRASSDPPGTMGTTGCPCQCTNAWAGPQCGSCPPNVDINQNCGACLPAYAGFPSCPLRCTVAANCSNHANSVTGDSNSGCTCACRNAWTTGTCAVCPSYWDPSTDCSACLQGYSGPSCATRVCDTTLDCNGHATSVSGSPGSCVCQCRNQWSGSNCSVCASGLDVPADCSRCLSGFGPFPICAPACTVDGACSGTSHATAVGGYQPNCTCTCRNRWSGVDCATCPSPYAGSACNECQAGMNGYPSCAQACTVAANCSNHATGVTGNVNTGCSCSCSDQWSGGTCNTCAAKYEPANCNSCASGYEIYPNCYRTCTNAQDCSGHATAVSGNVNGGCTCTCYSQWNGQTCSQCLAGLNQTANPSDPGSVGCDRCIDGYSGFPACSRTCGQQDCSNHAQTVTGNTPNCNCSCRNQWKGSTCSVCGTLYNATDDCGSCVAGATGYPTCYRPCDVTADCNGHAASVQGTSETGCNCTCRNSWYGTTCAACASQFNSSDDCGSCAQPLYGGTYPSCVPRCTVAADCNGRASAVTGLRPECSCTCTAQWTGAACATCPLIYLQSTCSSCASGYSGYPTCSPLCTVSSNCNGHASSVSGTLATGCTCNCRYNWNGTDCSQCPDKYNPSSDCNQCAAGRVNYPRCALACDASVLCNDHGSVSGDQEIGCTCNCRNSWYGSNCSQCPVNIDVSRDCAFCVAGYTIYPSCYRVCTTSLDCNGHASTVSGNVQGGCSCACRNRWEGLDCSVCRGRYNSSADCSTCMVDAVAWTFPRCYVRCEDVS